MKPPHGTASLTLTINGVHYLIRLNEAHPGVARKAWRLTKADGTTYDVGIREFGTECSCGDFNFRRQQRGQQCKHIRAMVAVGLLS